MPIALASISEVTNQILAVLFTLCSGVDKSTDAGAQKKQIVIDEIQKLFSVFNAPKWVIGIFESDFVLGFIIDIIAGLLNKTTVDEKALPFIDSARQIALLVTTVVQLKEAELGSLNGTTKKEEAVSTLQGMVTKINAPEWSKNIFGNSVVLGALVDVTVNTLNKTGIFKAN